MKHALLAALVLLVGCEKTPNELSQATDSIVYLYCPGVEISGGTSERKELWYLIKFDENRPRDNLQYYLQEEQRFFPSACTRNFQGCQLNVSSDVIEEVGTMLGSDNEPLLTVITTINRRTGKMLRERIDSELKREIDFEGVCEKTNPPAVQTQKF